MLSAITPAAARIQASPRLAYFIFSFIFSAGKLRPDNRLFHLRPSGGSAGFPNSRVCKYFTLMLSVLRVSLNNKSCSRRVQTGTGPCCDCSVFGGSEEQVHGTWVFSIRELWVWFHTAYAPADRNSVRSERGRCSQSFLLRWLVLLLSGSALCNLGKRVLTEHRQCSGQCCYSPWSGLVRSSFSSGTFSNTAW